MYLEYTKGLAKNAPKTLGTVGHLDGIVRWSIMLGDAPVYAVYVPRALIAFCKIMIRISLLYNPFCPFK